MMEVWRPVPKYNMQWPGGQPHYEVSNLGGIRDAAHDTFRGGWRNEKSVKVFEDESGYQYVRLQCADMRVHSLFLHGLVALAFLDTVSDKSQVRHKDGDIKNNTVGNLEWVSEGGQEVDFTHRVTDRMANGEYSVNGIRQYTYTGELVGEFLSSYDVFDTLGHRAGAVAEFCRKKPVGSVRFGYVWRFADDDELYELSVEARKLAIGMRPVRGYDTNGWKAKEYPSIAIATQFTASVHGGIKRCCERKQITCSGYIWRYVDDDEFADGGVDIQDFFVENYRRGGRRLKTP